VASNGDERFQQPLSRPTAFIPNAIHNLWILWILWMCCIGRLGALFPAGGQADGLGRLARVG